ncbi:MAG: hypothetical protein G01um101429_633 [Parcubacteria group bacterium Gr01-1014_29]|nr:MAG: hypothetical protein G01um101429_633 [Parcubacteria group bacterium Gr01-1014_29]
MLLAFAGGVVLAQTSSLCVATLNTPDSSQPHPGLLVKSDLSCATFQVKGPVEYSGDGYYFSKFDAPPGTYTITWGSVPGYIAPLPEIKEFKEGGKLLFVGSYNEVGYPQGKGTIKVYLLNSFPPPIPHFTLKGPTTRTGELGFKWEEEMPVGTYTITYEDLDDHGAPPPETKTLERNGTITFDAAYGPPKAHVFIIDSKPTGAKVYLDGSLLGNAPIKAKVPLDSKKHTIRCSLPGYEDYNYYDYRAQEPDSTTYSIGAKWTCAMVAKKDSSSSQVKEPVPTPTQAPTPEKEITPSSVSGVPAQQPPPKPQRSFFFRFWEGISSFFRRLF